MLGVIELFDGDVGLGELEGPDGRSYRFHCTEIMDGSRQVDVGTAVEFGLRRGHLGTVEACSVVTTRAGLG